MTNSSESLANYDWPLNAGIETVIRGCCIETEAIP